MLAGQFTAPDRIELVECPEPEPPSASDPGKVLFETTTACLCGSDVPYFTGEEASAWPQQLGLSLHEMVGRVRASTSARFQVGQRVLMVPEKQVGFFERQVVSEERVVALDDRLSEPWAVFAQPLGTVIWAAKKLPNLIDRDVAVVGQGPMGQIFNAVLSNLGARRIVGIDPVAARRERSRGFGATDTIDAATADPAAALRSLLGPEGPDLVVEVVGHREQALDLCIDLAPRGGTILYFGVPEERIERVSWRRLFLKNLSVLTSVDPDFQRDFPLAVRWLAEGRIDLRDLTTHSFPLERIQEAYEIFRDRAEGALKVIVEFPAARKWREEPGSGESERHG